MKYLLFTICLLLGAVVALPAQSNVSFEIGSNTNGPNGQAIVQGDFNNDGKPDLVVGGDNLLLQLGNGDGTFQTAKTIATMSQGTQDLAAADLNGDGKLDLVAVDFSGSIEVLFGNGNGTFQTPVTLTPVYFPTTVAVGNFTGGSLLDLAVGDANGTVEIFRNEGGDKFTMANPVSVAPGQEIYAIRAGDFDGSGNADLAVATGFSAYALWGNGSGSFKPVTLATYPQSPISQITLNVGDLRQDGKDDILVSYSCATSGNYCIGIDAFYGEANQSILRSHIITDVGDRTYGSLCCAPWAIDVNGDGVADIVLWGSNASNTQSGLFVWLGKPDGTFDQTPQRFVVASDGGAPIVPGDWNRDGMMGFAAASTDGGSTGSIFINSTLRAGCSPSTINQTVTVCQPVNNTYSPSLITLKANAFDPTAVTSMQEYVDSKLVYSKDNVSSFDISLPESLGAHSLVTKAWSTKGVDFVSDRNIILYSGTPGQTCAAGTNAAAICLPSGTTSASPVHIVGNGYSVQAGNIDDSIIPTAAQLYIDGKLVINNKGAVSYVDTEQPLAAGTHDLVFKLWNAEGDVYTASKTITVE